MVNLCGPTLTYACYTAGHYWVGHVVDAGTNHVLGKGVVQQVTKQRDTINDTMFTKDDIAIAIEWCDLAHIHQVSHLSHTCLTLGSHLAHTWLTLGSHLALLIGMIAQRTTRG